MNNTLKYPRLCLITFTLPEFEGGHIFVLSLLQLLEPLAEQIITITGNYPESAIFSPKIELRNIKNDSKRQSIVIRSGKYLGTQARICYELIKTARKVDAVIFYVGGTALVLPMLAAKLLRKKTVLIAVGSTAESVEQTHKNSMFGVGSPILTHLMKTLEMTNYALSDKIVVLSDSLVDSLGLGKYANKINYNCATFIDTERFAVRSRIQERKNLVGYIGRLSEEKGVMNFVRAMPMVAKSCDVDFLIGGDGPMLNDIKAEVARHGLSNKVSFTKWIPHDRVPDYLDKLKLLVMPSYTEAFPGIALEAMACGTPVLVAPVGAAPDIVQHGHNGFLLKDNSPQCIAQSIGEALNYPKLANVAMNARNVVREKYSYDAILTGYENVLCEL